MRFKISKTDYQRLSKKTALKGDEMEKGTQVDRKVIDSIIDNYQANREALLMILQDVSEVYNYVPPEVVPILVERLGVKKSLVYSVATFYKSLSLEPRGKHVVHVCTGTACHVRGAGKILEAIEETLHIKEGQTTTDFSFTLEAVRCIGCCASGPVITVNKDTYGGLDRSSVVRLLDEYKKAAS
jgi:NADH:ubiquinone oxidoreductase subunit E